MTKGEIEALIARADEWLAGEECYPGDIDRRAEILLEVNVVSRGAP